MKSAQPLRLSWLVLSAIYLPLPVWAADTDSERLQRLEYELSRQREAIELQREQLRQQTHRLETQQQVIERQSRLLEQQDSALQRIRAQLLQESELGARRGAGPGGVQSGNSQPGAAPRTQVSQADTQAPSPDSPVGQAPPKQEKIQRPEIQSIANIGGVLTPKGRWVLEPSLQFSNSQVNRLSFLGVEILETFLIGVLQAEDADRNLLSPALTVRYGMTPRLELEGRIPYIWRDDTLKATIPSVTSEPQITRDLEGNGIGDVELAMHYQLNGGNKGWPIFIGNVRYKSATGDGPYDVARNDGGIQTELPTGSGFHAIEPSITALYPSDPAVFYANLGYLYNIEKDVDKTFSVEGSDDQTIGNVDPGDVIRISFGMAYSINSKASFSLGYKHDFIHKTDTEINGVNLSTSSLDVGSMLLGFSHRITPRLNANLNLELGITADAPDVGITLRLPYMF